MLRSNQTLTFRSWAFLVTGAALLALPFERAARGQQTGTLPLDTSESSGYSRPVSPVLEWQDEEVSSFLASASFQALTPEEADDLYLLAKVRPGLVLPFLEEKLESGLNNGSLERDEVLQIVDLLSYAANEQALSGLSRLLAEFDTPLLDRAVGRLLDYADGRSNSYSLAYRAMVIGSSRVQGKVVNWVEEKAALGHGFEDWASAILERGDSTSVKTLLERDPIVASLEGGQAPRELVKEIEKQVRERSQPRIPE